MEITLYKTKDDNRTVNKTLTDASNKNVELLSEFNFDDLNIRLTGIVGTLAYNYLYAPKLKKYFFITDANYYAKNTCIIKCHIDVLMTFKDELLNCRGLLNNFSQNKYPYSDNYNTPLSSEPFFETSFIDDIAFPTQPINVLVVVNDRKDAST